MGDVLDGLATAGAGPIILTTCVGIVLTGTSISKQNQGDKNGALYIVVPYGLLTLGAIIRAINYPQDAGQYILGSIFTGIGTTISAIPLMLPEDKAHTSETIYGTSFAGYSMTILGFTLMSLR
jgi:hypothetical protein